MPKHTGKLKKINIITLGCSKNLVDSEYLLRQFEANNIAVTHNDESADARTVIINTCGFIHDAKEESVNTILGYIKAKQDGRIDHVFVMGCLSQRYKTDLEKEIPDVDSYFGVNSLKEVISTIGLNYRYELTGERKLTTPAHYAYLKIAEGCDQKCAFCAIPLIRGKLKSRKAEDILEEAEALCRKGVKELILIAQDLTAYGTDIYKKKALAELLTRLSDIRGLEWIRLHYAYPVAFPKDVINVMKERNNICKYLDIPFQHHSNSVLSAMKRGHSSRENIELIQYIRSNIPDITLRTTVLTGFPGETEKDFKELLSFIKEVRFDRLGVFTYSEEEGTSAASALKDDVPDAIKKARADEIMYAQQQISKELNFNKIGKSFKVLIDDREGEYFTGRTEADSPEVDNEVLISPGNKTLQAGKFYNITITAAEEFTLFGKTT